MYALCVCVCVFVLNIISQHKCTHTIHTYISYIYNLTQYIESHTHTYATLTHVYTTPANRHITHYTHIYFIHT